MARRTLKEAMVGPRRPTLKETMLRTSLYINEDLLHRLKVAAAEERIKEGVSGLLSRLAEDWLAKRKGGRR
jgi:hypothetical protein